MAMAAVNYYGTDVWDELVPDMVDDGVYVPAFMATVEVGSFFVSSNTSHKGVVMRLVSFDAKSRTYKANLFPSFDSSRYASVVSAIACGFGFGIPEVYQSRKTIEITSKDVEEICFVVHDTILEKNKTVGHGMANFYVVRYREAKPLSLAPEEMQANTFLSFPCSYPDFKFNISLGRKIFKQIEYVRELIEKKMNKYGDTQGDRPATCISDIPFDCDTWAYVIRQAKVAVDTALKKKKRSRIVPNVSFRSISFRQTDLYEVLDFNTEREYEVAQSIFGSTIVVGVRHLRPKLGCLFELQRHDRVNLVTDDGYLQLLYCRDRTSLTVRMKLDSYMYDVAEEGFLLGLDPPSYAAPLLGIRRITTATKNNRVNTAIGIGDTFEEKDDGSIFKVTAIGETVTAVCLMAGAIYSKGTFIDYNDFNEVRNKITAYNN